MTSSILSINLKSWWHEIESRWENESTFYGWYIPYEPGTKVGLSGQLTSDRSSTRIFQHASQAFGSAGNHSSPLEELIFARIDVQEPRKKYTAPFVVRTPLKKFDIKPIVPLLQKRLLQTLYTTLTPEQRNVFKDSFITWLLNDNDTRLLYDHPEFRTAYNCYRGEYNQQYTYLFQTLTRLTHYSIESIPFEDRVGGTNLVCMPQCHKPWLHPQHLIEWWGEKVMYPTVHSYDLANYYPWHYARHAFEITFYETFLSKYLEGYTSVRECIDEQ